MKTWICKANQWITFTDSEEWPSLWLRLSDSQSVSKLDGNDCIKARNLKFWILNITASCFKYYKKCLQSINVFDDLQIVDLAAFSFTLLRLLLVRHICLQHTADHFLFPNKQPLHCIVGTREDPIWRQLWAFVVWPVWMRVLWLLFDIAWGLLLR